MSQYIRQFLLEQLNKQYNDNKAIIILGPRQTGKTTLLQHYLKDKEQYLLANGDDIFTREALSSESIEQLKNYIGNNTLLVIDEAQKIPNIGLNLKLISDHCPQVKIIATGSSAFDLSAKVGEPLTGRKWTLRMFPLSQIELNAYENTAQTKANLANRLIYGSYPESVTTNDLTLKRDYLLELVSSYLYKDILELEGLKKSHQIIQILQLLAFQIGKEVSVNEIAQKVGLNKITVNRYLDLLERNFVLVKVNGFSRNLRKEITKTCRYYFYDCGVRNALINQFQPLNIRNDIGELWENYLIMERLKKQHYYNTPTNNYFWRTYSQQEIDWVEERDGLLTGYEIKYTQQKVKAPKEWQTHYPDAGFEVIHQNNYLKFISERD